MFHVAHLMLTGGIIVILLYSNSLVVVGIVAINSPVSINVLKELFDVVAQFFHIFRVLVLF